MGKEIFVMSTWVIFGAVGDIALHGRSEPR